jgi:maleate cis-trans isomerase
MAVSQQLATESCWGRSDKLREALMSEVAVLSPEELSEIQIVPARARIGIILSSSNRVVEGQLHAFAPPTLAIHVTRMNMSKDRTLTMPEQLDTILHAAQLVADAKVDLIVLQASAFAMEKGPKAEEAIVDEIQQTTGIPALTSTQAMVKAARALGLKRLINVSPSSGTMNDKEKAYLQAQGFEVLHAVGLNVEAGAGLTMTAVDWLNVVKANGRPEADGYFLSGSNTTIVEAIGTIEKLTGKPAVSSAQATLWASVRHVAKKLGPDSVLSGPGRLFTIA